MNGTRGRSPAPPPRAPLPVTSAEKGRRGEIEIRDEDVGGIGVHIAARALTQAADRVVFVTRTVRDLATSVPGPNAPSDS